MKFQIPLSFMLVFSLISCGKGGDKSGFPRQQISGRTSGVSWMLEYPEGELYRTDRFPVRLELSKDENSISGETGKDSSALYMPEDVNWGDFQVYDLEQKSPGVWEARLAPEKIGDCELSIPLRASAKTPAVPGFITITLPEKFPVLSILAQENEQASGKLEPEGLRPPEKKAFPLLPLTAGAVLILILGTALLIVHFRKKKHNLPPKETLASFLEESRELLASGTLGTEDSGYKGFYIRLFPLLLKEFSPSGFSEDSSWTPGDLKQHLIKRRDSSLWMDRGLISFLDRLEEILFSPEGKNLDREEIEGHIFLFSEILKRENEEGVPHDSL